ncbi:carboxypeptidase S [[Candida] jaroonii]|uniref:Carboxypeptidase S n=1 Tax=[Candida] jaroonii TaxID=467808 RepID=A0ACA9YBC0_9ASCO|nr:carboxypeptidase S [[Candida] jaroonii]
MSETLPLYPKAPKSTDKWNIAKKFVYGLIVILVFTYSLDYFTTSAEPTNPDSFCPLVPKIKATHDEDVIDMILNDKKFRKQSTERWSDSVKIPTVLFDGTIHADAVEDKEELYKLEPLWKNFEKFHDFLNETYPLVHKKTKVEKVNKFGLIYTWEGKNSSLQPIFLNAHQDVVPVEETTIDQWSFPPFEGVESNGFVYGRGVSDCKNLLIGIMETIELLLQNKFKPERTIIIGFGYDEESAGLGAKAIADFLLDRYGPQSIYMLIDEGSEGFMEIGGTKFIAPATSEKGYLDSQIDLFTPGGHSSVPPKNTGIGIMSRLITLIEDTEFKSMVTNGNPTLGLLQCMAEHSNIEKSLKSDILRAQFDVEANARLVHYLINEGGEQKAVISTSQAVDMITGGVKSNALPEHVSAVVNHRIAFEESVQSTSEKILGNIQEIAERFELGIIMDGKVLVEPTKNGYFNYTLREALEPAPVTATGTEVWNLFGGSLRYFYEDIMFPKLNETYVVSPLLAGGNTDTKSYWDLTTNIFRYQPGTGFEDSNIHSVDEMYPIDGHLAVIAFYYFFLQNLH